MAVKPEGKKNRLVALDIRPKQLILCAIDLSAEQPCIKHLAIAELKDYLDVSEMAAHIRTWNAKFKLNDWSWSLSLNRPDYQLQMMEAPNLPDDEIHDALQLKALDFVNQPEEELVIDTLLLPNQAFAGRRKMAFAVIAQKARLGSLSEMMLEMGLKLVAIDIYEQAIRNLISLSMPVERAALVLMGEDSSSIIMTFDDQICLQRQLEFGVSHFQRNNHHDPDNLLQSPLKLQMDSMALEIQRSFDYYESQLNLGGVSELKVLQPGGVPEELVSVFTQAFGAKSSWLELSQHLDCAVADSDELHHYYSAIGAALRFHEGYKI